MKAKLKFGLKILLVAFWVIAGVNHFVNPNFYTNLMPGYLPWHLELVYLSGITEIIAGVLVAFPRTMKWGAWFIYAHLIVFMMVHLHMLDYASTKFAEISIVALWVRLPVQVLFALWAWWCTQPDTPRAVSTEEAVTA